MGALDVKVPSVGESVTEALLAQWFKNDGDLIRKDEALFVLETDKVTLEVTAEAAGVLHIRVPAGTTVAPALPKRLGPKSGSRSASVAISFASPSYSPRRIYARSRRSGRVAARSYR